MQQIIDITNQKVIPYPFAESAMTAVDKLQTKKILKKIYKHIAEFSDMQMRPNSVTFIKKNRRSLRIVLYDINTLIAEKDLFVVIFYADKRNNLSEEFNKQFFETDWKIAMSLMGSNAILCYASEELKDGNWFNVVLFSKESEKHTVLASDTHKYAAYKMAPKRFNWIRLHNALLPKGINEYKDILFQKTKYYNFDENWFAVRMY